MKSLSPKQRQTLEAILRSLRQRGMPPILDEIAEAIGVKSRFGSAGGKTSHRFWPLRVSRLCLSFSLKREFLIKVAGYKAFSRKNFKIFIPTESRSSSQFRAPKFCA